MLRDAGLVALPPSDWGVQVEPLRRDLHMSIRRTPHGVMPETGPGAMMDSGRVVITPNAQIISLDGAFEDAVSALDKAGPRGAAALGVGVGFLFSESRIVGALVGGLIGYFGGKYVVNLAKKAIAVQQAVSTVASVVPTAKAG
jgi:hypothetical protein